VRPGIVLKTIQEKIVESLTLKYWPGISAILKWMHFLISLKCRSSIEAAMHFVNHANSLIFDLRQNHGGDPHTVALIASYLFDHPTHLNDMYSPRSGTTEETWTQSPTPGNTLAGKPTFVLTSAMTFSGGEEFCYDLKMLKRATIVGERTGGGAHQIRLHKIDDHFTIAVPFAKPVNPISKTDWEGSGVVPNVSVKARDALETAIKLATDEPERHK
jgi:C-terminal processing protease CtpA/Prc